MKFNNKTLKIFVKSWHDEELRQLVENNYGHISTWDTSEVTDMSELFIDMEYFNDDINNWDVSKVTNMSFMFYGCIEFNKPLNKWDVSNVMDMSYMFNFCYNFRQSINDWDISNVVNNKYMFINDYPEELKPNNLKSYKLIY